MDIREFYSKEYLCLIINYYEHQINALPSYRVFLRTKRGKQVACIKECGKNVGNNHEYYLASDKGKELIARKDRKNELENKCLEYKNIWYEKTAFPIPKLSIEEVNAVFYAPKEFKDIDFYNQLVDQSSVKKYGKDQHPHMYKDIPMRTKIEMFVASILDDLDLSYKYEPSLILGSYEKYTDFFIGIPFLNICFPTEVAGKMPNKDYRTKMLNDLEKYYVAGFVFTKNMLLIIEDEDCPASDEEIGEMICDFINRITHKAFVSAGIKI